MKVISSLSNMLVSTFDGIGHFINAFSAAGLMAERAMDAEVAKQDLVHAKRMAELLKEAQDAGVQLSVTAAALPAATKTKS